MKYILLLLGCLCLLEAQYEYVKITPIEHNFGNISDSQEVRCSYDVTNISKQVLKLQKIETSCGCTVAEPAVKELSPGETTKLNVSFDPRNREGRLFWEIRVHSNLSSDPFRLMFQVNILKDNYITEDRMFFGKFHRGTPASKTIWISPKNYSDFKITDIQLQMPGNKKFFDVSYAKEMYDGFYPKPRYAYKVTVTARKDIPFGRVSGKMLISSNFSPLSNLEIPVIGEATGEIIVSRKHLAMGMVKLNKPITRDVLVYHVDENKRFDILKVETSLPFVTTKLKTVIEKQYYEIYVTATAVKGQVGEFRGKLAVTTSVQPNKPIIIPIQGFVRGK